MRKFGLVALLAVAVAGNANAQAGRTEASIDPGMTKDQVIARLGRPASEHSSGTHTFLFYANGQEKRVGMNDMVALEEGKVVDAVFRSSARRYTGKSSSPAPVSREAAIAKGHGGRAPAMKMPPAKMPPAKAPETKKVTPMSRKPEPLKKPDEKKIQPAPKPAETAKKAAPAPVKKP